MDLQAIQAAKITLEHAEKSVSEIMMALCQNIPHHPSIRLVGEKDPPRVVWQPADYMALGIRLAAVENIVHREVEALGEFIECAVNQGGANAKGGRK